MQLLQDSLSALRNQYALFKEEFIAKLHLLSTTLPLISSVIQERTKTATEASGEYSTHIIIMFVNVLGYVHVRMYCSIIVF